MVGNTFLCADSAHNLPLSAAFLMPNIFGYNKTAHIYRISKYKQNSYDRGFYCMAISNHPYGKHTIKPQNNQELL